MTTRSPARTRVALAAGAGIVALNAFAGGLALVTGVIDFGPVVTDRLPARSPVLAGLALVLVVALPMTAATVRAAAGHPKWAGTAVFAGCCLIGWIVLQVLVIRTFTWLQPVMAAAGMAVLLAGLRGARRR
ncbi:hypothetical protein [Saccharothrix variisporea]|uniref:Uncharacterized protein n=1 Tax=Saccharothrix variisporea TaxID=543527 RepID=A0A495XMW0_9PSEU|nr:hypothetical protein [Saccharothrix variisporea]RKT74535.1 hypothetical protein DFJ66_7895 [Saccharothrix variisporea]